MSGVAVRRTQQWATYGRLWHLFDAKWQDPFKSSVLLAKYLKGKHKPIYLNQSDCGDHVVVINTYRIALAGDEWEKRVYYHHTGYKKGASWTFAHELHSKDPTLIMKKAVYSALGNNEMRRNCMARLHLFPHDKIPNDIINNITNQIRQLREVPKCLDEYSQEEIDKFPKLFDYPKDFVIPKFDK